MSAASDRFKRRNKISEQFCARLIEMLKSPAYRVLTKAAHLALSRIEIELGHHGGKENGKLPVTFKDFVKYGIPRANIGPALAELEALGFVKVTERGQKARAAEYRRANKFLLTTRPELEGVGPECCKWRRFKTLEEAQAVADAAREEAKGGRRSPNLKVAGSESEPLTVQKANRKHVLSGSLSEPLGMSESEPLSKSRVRTQHSVTLLQRTATRPTNGEIAVAQPFATPLAQKSRPAPSRRASEVSA